MLASLADPMAWDPRFVIPAEAGIQVRRGLIVLLRLAAGNLDSRLRGNDVLALRTDVPASLTCWHSGLMYRLH